MISITISFGAILASIFYLFLGPVMLNLWTFALKKGVNWPWWAKMTIWPWGMYLIWRDRNAIED